jgi:hypothetical protein
MNTTPIANVVHLTALRQTDRSFSVFDEDLAGRDAGC